MRRVERQHLPARWRIVLLYEGDVCIRYTFYDSDMPTGISPTWAEYHDVIWSWRSRPVVCKPCRLVIRIEVVIRIELASTAAPHGTCVRRCTRPIAQARPLRRVHA